MLKQPINTTIFEATKLTASDYLTIGERLLKGATCVVPTETVYGLAANGLDRTAIAKIYEAKGRPSDNPLILHVADSTMLKRIVTHISEDARRLMDAYWPGPLTLVFKKDTTVPNEVTGGLVSVAVRMPSHPVMQALIHAANTPLAAPSANLSGRPSSTTFAHVKNDLFGRVDMIIDGGESTIGFE
jgi:L-threonylcarbamoyladenylate synthase